MTGCTIAARHPLSIPETQRQARRQGQMGAVQVDGGPRGPSLRLGTAAVGLVPSEGKASPIPAGAKSAPARSLDSLDCRDEHDDILAAVTRNTQ
jgi:hypothetical protein